jgi:uncharacterized RDD family membrane protein YckC
MQEQNLEYAGFWIRLGASLIDSILVIALTYPLLIAIYGWGYFDSEKTGFIAGTADLLLSWVAPAIAVVLFWVYRQATSGKMMLSLRVVDARTGSPPSTAQCIGRYLAYYPAMIPLFAGFIWVAFDTKKQGWHDKLAGTVVVRSRRQTTEPVRFDQTG